MRPTMPSLVAVFAIWVCASCSQEAHKAKTIPFREMYATVPQDGMKRVVLADELPFDQLKLERFLKLRPQASNIFLTKAAGLKGVDGVTYAGICFRAYRELAVSKADDETKLWLVVFFGFAPNKSHQWTLNAIEYSRSKIRVTYTVAGQEDKSSKNFEPYFVFVPVQELDIGDYELELYESARRETTFVRHVQVLPVER